MIRIDISKIPVEDLEVLVKAAYWLSIKGEWLPSRHGYTVPVREFERVRAKVGRMVEHV